MDPQSQHLFAFATDRQVFIPKRILQGARNSSQFFQNIMCKILQTYLDKNLLIHIDDILIFAPNIQILFNIVKQVLNKFKEHRIHIRWKFKNKRNLNIQRMEKQLKLT